MLQGQACVGAQVYGKGEHVDGAAADLVAQVAEEEWGDGLHYLVDGHGEVEFAEGAVIRLGDGRDGGEVDEGGEGREEGAEGGHEDDEDLSLGREDGVRRCRWFVAASRVDSEVGRLAGTQNAICDMAISCWMQTLIRIRCCRRLFIGGPGHAVFRLPLDGAKREAKCASESHASIGHATGSGQKELPKKFKKKKKQEREISRFHL